MAIFQSENPWPREHKYPDDEFDMVLMDTHFFVKRHKILGDVYKISGRTMDIFSISLQHINDDNTKESIINFINDVKFKGFEISVETEMWLAKQEKL